jgi:hypothetical protein
VQGQVLAVAVKSKRINGWSKRASPQQPQTNESNSPTFWISMVSPVYLLNQDGLHLKVG